MILSIQLQASINDVQSIVSTNTATVSGVLLAFCIVMALALRYIFNKNQEMMKDCQIKYEEIQNKYILELKNTNDILMKLNASYNEISLKMLNAKNEK